MLFHPYEIALCGFSGSGKTTLAAAVVNRLSERFTVGCYKHGCHRFDIDREGKDSFIFKDAGAETVMISDPVKKAVISRNGSTGIREREIFRACDMLIVEGLKELPLPKLLMVDRERKILDRLAEGTIPGVIALVETGNEPDQLKSLYDLPVFHRDDVQTVTAFIESCIAHRAMETPLSGLILAGGKSSRMGTDKALITYHGKNQLIHTSSLLSSYCREVFISCRADQKPKYEAFGLPIITDRYLETGPAGGILSAQSRYPERAWLTVACDMPFLGTELLDTLLDNRMHLRFATAFRNEDTGHYEPLCACYEPKSRQELLARHAEGDDSLHSFLADSRIGEIAVSDTHHLLNINDPEALRAALNAGSLPGGEQQ
ncbi:MAG: bifunctional molybdenum cofactor guanylyltransferase MobA/molybdopterin-guanine dinucleotide biosynthesis adaptor protein MobB [Chlorobiaceae bacterium]|jgi:molybdopterin-guanine dinucleotide biosynthesis protein A|nr:bifunctional molybdenum cofactor guanylyltransferase MobA/molybdopterin-guanine dinucleotide biosynthesis adaptor protein MobB [Chlorobiaceae bacterium]